MTGKEHTAHLDGLELWGQQQPVDQTRDGSMGQQGSALRQCLDAMGQGGGLLHILEEATRRPAVFSQKLLVGASWRHTKPQEAFSKVLGAHQSLMFGFGALQGPKRKGAGSPEWQRTH